MTRFQGTKTIFENDTASLVRTGHPEHPQGIWIVEIVHDFGRETADTADPSTADRWLADMKDGVCPEPFRGQD